VITLELLIIILLTVVNGILAMSEIAIVSARKTRLQQMADEGHEGARAALELAASPSRFLSTVQIGITLIGILAGAFGGATVATQLNAQLNQISWLAPYSETVSLIVVVLFTTYSSLVIGELVPKRLGLQNPERVAVRAAPWMWRLAKLTAPVVWLLTKSTDLILRLLGAKASNEPPVTEEEVAALIRQGVQHGVFEAAEHEMVVGVFSLGERRVDSLMTPRLDIEWLNLDDPLADNLGKIVNSRHSRFPVARGSLDNIQGILRSKDLLNRSLTGQPTDLHACIKEPLFIPESAPASRALELFKQSNKHIALVISEYGGIEGVLTINDLVAEIVGDLDAPQAVQRADGSWLVDGLMPIDEFKDLFAIKALPDEEEGHYQTLGGFVMSYLGRIPAAADHFELDGLYIEVMDMDGKRVDKLLVKRDVDRPSPSG
jgi:putative hemolysin